MRRREDFLLEKHTVNFFPGDYRKLQGWFSTRIGAGKVIRDLVHAFVRKTEEEAAQRAAKGLPPVPPSEIGAADHERSH